MRLSDNATAPQLLHTLSLGSYGAVCCGTPNVRRGPARPPCRLLGDGIVAATGIPPPTDVTRGLRRRGPSDRSRTQVAKVPPANAFRPTAHRHSHALRC